VSRRVSIEATWSIYHKKRGKTRGTPLAKKGVIIGRKGIWGKEQIRGDPTNLPEETCFPAKKELKGRTLSGRPAKARGSLYVPESQPQTTKKKKKPKKKKKKNHKKKKTTHHTTKPPGVAVID